MYWRLEQTVHAERDTIVGPEEGIHARPASQFVKRAKPTEFSLHRRTCPGGRGIEKRSLSAIVRQATAITFEGPRLT
jgi:phosphotransferase system HPr-like phosphotransfer protein